jgi:hypothetical protein
VTSARSAVRRGRSFAVLAAAAVIAVPGALSACQSSGNGDSAAASRIARQIAASASFPLYIRGEYKTLSANEAWIEVLPRAAAAMNLPAKDGCDDMQTWLRSHGGLDSGWSQIEIVLRARQKVNVVITAAESVILNRYPAASAPYTLTCVPGKSSWVEQEESLNWPNYTPGFVLDVNHDLGTPWQPAHYSSYDNAFTMMPGAEQYELLTGFTSSCDCAWGVELYLTVNGTPRHVLVENGKEPFRTAPGPAYPDDSARNAVWCADSGQPRLDPPRTAGCPPPVTYEQVPVF